MVLVEESGGMFQIRPHKDFTPATGRDRLLSLRLLSDLALNETDPQPLADVGGGSEVKNAYNYMNRRREIRGDPTMKRRNASIRLSNFASAESTPLCVR